MSNGELDSFAAFLKSSLDLQDGEIPVDGEWSHIGNTIGALALRTGILPLDKINDIMDRQESADEHRLFGQIAIELAYLTPDEVDRLIAIQGLNMQVTLAGQLMLQGRLDLPGMLNVLKEYAMANPHAGAGRCVDELESITPLCST